MSNITPFTTKDLIIKFEDELKNNANYQNNKAFFDNVIDAVGKLKSICVNDCLKSSTYDDIDTISKINTNSLYFIDDLPWREKGDSSLSSSKIMQVLNNLVRSICDNTKVLKRKDKINNSEKCILEQSWRIFAIILYAFVSGNYVQMMSLLDTNYSIAMINYMTDGDLSDCQNYIHYFFRNTIPHLKNKRYTYTDVSKFLSEFKKPDSHNCEKCSGLNPCKIDPIQIFPCYSLIKKIQMHGNSKNNTYSDSLFPSFIYSNFNVIKNIKKQNFEVLRNDYISFLLNSNKCNMGHYNYKELSWYSDGKNYYSSNVDYKVFHEGKFPSKNSISLPSVNVIDNAVGASNLRNVLAHGNVKEPTRNTVDIYWNSTELKKRIVESLVNQLIYLLSLSKDIYFTDGNEKIFGLKMVNYFFSDNKTYLEMH